MKMNLPNQLTIFRVLLVPVYVVLAVTDLIAQPAKGWVLLTVFCVASITDCLDGNIARYHHLESDFGRFMDPVADKLLVGAAIICFVEAGVVPAWAVIIIIGREFLISGFRLVAAGKQIVIAADFFGKLKTVVQMTAIIWLLIPWKMEWFNKIGQILFYLSVLLSVISIVHYVWKNSDVLKENKA